MRICTHTHTHARTHTRTHAWGCTQLWIAPIGGKQTNLSSIIIRTDGATMLVCGKQQNT
jgi:hypothetical protein